MKDFLKTSRFWTLYVVAAVALVWYFATDPNGGLETLSRLQWLAWMAVIPLPVYWLRKGLLQGFDARRLLEAAQQSPTGAGLAILGICMVTASLVIALSNFARM
jgi:hypothetical protein